MRQFVDVIRGITRPIIIIVTVIATVLFIWYSKEIPEQWWALVAIPVGWWFWDRSKAKNP